MMDTIKLDNIHANLEIIDSETLLQILPNQNGKIVLDWSKGDVQSLNVKIGENSTVEILEIGEADSLKINYDLSIKTLLTNIVSVIPRHIKGVYGIA